MQINRQIDKIKNRNQTHNMEKRKGEKGKAHCIHEIVGGCGRRGRKRQEGYMFWWVRETERERERGWGEGNSSSSSRK